MRAHLKTGHFAENTGGALGPARVVNRSNEKPYILGCWRVNHIDRTALSRTNALPDALPPLGSICLQFFFLFGVIIPGAVAPASLVLGSALVFGAG